MRPQSTIELWKLLTEIFPGFASSCPVEELEADAPFHAVMFEFTPYFSRHREEFSEKQIKAFGNLVNEAVAVDDTLENAIGTCFLEHLRQVDSYKVLAPHLSSKAKAKTHA